MFSILIVDDEFPARQMMRMLVEGIPGYAVVGEASNGRQALELYRSKRPDVILTDIEMPVMNGLELIESVKAENPDQPIVILSCYESFSYAQRAMRSGVRSYLIKDMTSRADMEKCLGDALRLSQARRAPDEDPIVTRNTVTFENIQKTNPLSAEKLEESLDKLFRAFFKHEANPCVVTLNSLYRFSVTGMLQYSLLEFINTTVISWISMEMNLFGIPVQEVFGGGPDPSARLEDCPSPEAMRDLLCGWVSRWFSVADAWQMISERSKRITQYIVDHYPEEITLESIAGELFVHPVYLSRSFKSDTTVNISNSLIVIRTEKAKLLLSLGNKKIADIAYAVGFKSTQGFYNAFKKQTGMSPAEYSRNV